MNEIPQFTCQELVEIVTLYFEDALTSAERQRFEMHVAVCAGCRTYVEQMRQTIHMTGTLTEADISLEARSRLLSAFRDWKRGEA